MASRVQAGADTARRSQDRGSDGKDVSSTPLVCPMVAHNEKSVVDVMISVITG